MLFNLPAFLDTIAYSEGTYDKGDNGYNILVGGQTFPSYADHPRISVYLPKLGEYSTAAGRYQVRAKTYDPIKLKLGLQDFGHAAQDEVAEELIKERMALAAVQEGDFDTATLRCSNIWASFPGAGYGQHENKLSDLRNFYLSRGGQLKEQIDAGTNSQDSSITA